MEFFSVQIVPPSGGLPANIQLDPDLTFVEILDNDGKFPVLHYHFLLTFACCVHAQSGVSVCFGLAVHLSVQIQHSGH